VSLQAANARELNLYTIFIEQWFPSLLALPLRDLLSALDLFDYLCMPDPALLPLRLTLLQRVAVVHIVVDECPPDWKQALLYKAVMAPDADWKPAATRCSAVPKYIELKGVPRDMYTELRYTLHVAARAHAGT
jgi:hypothetical protein